MQVVDLLVGSLVSMGLTYLFVRGDSRSIPPHWRARGWNSATTGAAIFAFSPLCILAHFWVTRRSPGGIARGLLALLLLVALQLGVQSVFAQAGWLGLLAVLVLAPLPLALAPWFALAVAVTLGQPTGL